MTAAERFASQRAVRLVNYRKIIAALGARNLSAEAMAIIIAVKPSTVRRYIMAMQRNGLAECLAEKQGMNKNCSVYQFIATPEQVKQFMKFISACETVEDEIGQSRRRMEAIASFGKRVVSVTPAKQVGMVRDILVAALFGPACAAEGGT